MAAKEKAKPKADAKGKKDKKGKKGAPEEGTVLSLAAHPKAKSQVRRAKGWGGMFGFVVAAVLSLKAGVPIDVAGERALLAGMIGYLVGWAASVTIWRQIMIAELKAKAEQVKQRREAAAAAAQQAAIPPKQ